MNTPYTACCGQLAKTPKKWLITGVAGFIGSNLLETLLKVDEEVVGLDNLGSGHQRNLDEVQPVHRDFPVGDVRHCQADIGKAQRLLGYAPTHRLAEGVAEAMPWYVGQGR